MSGSEIFPILFGALQASASVLLVIFYGVLASQFQLLPASHAKSLSTLAVKLLLPFLLITNLGNQLTLSNISQYVPILLWSLFYNGFSLVLGLVAVRLASRSGRYHLPRWVVPAVTFNNTTSLPLLLVQSMESTGILKGVVSEDEDMSGAIERAKSYFLVCAVVSNSLTFALGPRLLGEGDGGDEEDESGGGDGREIVKFNNTDNLREHRGIRNGGGGQRQENDQVEQHDETTSLLPDRVNQLEAQALGTAHTTVHTILHRARMHPDDFSPKAKTILSILASFFNAPLIGAIIGCFLGLTPPLHRAFFADADDGGIFTAWLTASMKNAGDLFVSLQVIIVGVKLSSSLRKLKRGEEGVESGRVPWSAVTFVFSVRYVFWPLVGIPIVYALAANGRLLGGDDAMLWFCMMLMPCGPPAMSLVPMADVADKDEGVQMSVAKLLTAMYAVSPVLAFAVVGSLRASQHALGS